MNLSLSNGVFGREGHDTIDGGTFNFVMTACLLWGFVLTSGAAYWAFSYGFYPGILGFIVLGLVLPIFGIYLSHSSSDPWISFLGYNLVVLPIGLTLGPVVHHYSPGLIMNAFGLTAGITLVMGIAGTLHPELFQGMERTLFLALLALLLVRILQLFIPFLAGLTVIDYIAAGIFSLYVAYDMSRASNIPKTYDNAVDVSVALYLDILNLFLTILKILGDRDR